MLTWLEREIKTPRNARLYAQEALIEEAGELVAEAMNRLNLSKSQLAKRIGVTKAHITQLLSGSRNMTLRTLADLMHAMGHRVVLTSSATHDKGESREVCWSFQSPKPVMHRWEPRDYFVDPVVHAA